MNLWKTSIKRIALTLLAAAVVVPAAQATRSQPVAGFDHLQDLTAMANRYQATTPAGNSHLQELTAMANRYQAQASRLMPTPPGYSHLQELTAMANQSSRVPIVGSVDVQTSAATTLGGFDWADAGIGAISGFAIALALAGTLLLVSRRRPRGQGAGTPTAA